MTVVIEPVMALQFVYDLLAANATLMGMATGGLHSEIVLGGTGFPRIIVQSQGGGVDQRIAEGARLIWSEPLITVKVVDKASTYARISPIAALAYDIVNATEDETADGRIVSCVRELSFLLPESDGDVQYRTIVQQFRLEVDSSNYD